MNLPEPETASQSSPGRFLGLVERASRRIPDAVPLFLWLSLAVVVASVIAATFGASARHPGTGEIIAAQNLLAAPHVRRLLVEMPKTFTGFPPLGAVLTIMIGIGIAERSGLIAAALGGLVRKAPARALPLAVVLAGILSSLASDAGFLVLPPLAAAIFAAGGRHPVAGVTAAYAGVSGGYSANLFVTALDPLLGGITETAAHMLDPSYQVLPTANWFLMVALVPLLAVAGALVTTRLIEPRLGAWVPPPGFEVAAAPKSAASARALRQTGLAALVLLALLLWLTLPANAVLRDPETGTIQPFFQAIIALLMLGFAVLGIVYGRTVGTIGSAGDAVKMAEATLADMALYVLVAFVAAHFLALFAWSNLGALIAIGGAGVLGSLGLGPMPLLVGIVLFCGFLNLLMTSASAKWALLAPVLVPMFMAAGLSPELTQAAYRIGDMGTNIIAPTMVYLPLLVAIAARYQPGFGIGAMLAAMLPYALVFLPVGTLALLAFVALDLPIGPGVAPLLPAAID